MDNAGCITGMRGLRCRELIVTSIVHGCHILPLECLQIRPAAAEALHAGVKLGPRVFIKPKRSQVLCREFFQCGQARFRGSARLLSTLLVGCASAIKIGDQSCVLFIFDPAAEIGSVNLLVISVGPSEFASASVYVTRLILEPQCAQALCLQVPCRIGQLLLGSQPTFRQ